MSEEFYSFDRALRDLQMDEEELKRLISEGEIRAFRDEDGMKFRREDVESLRHKDDVDVIEQLESVEEEDSIPTLEMESREVSEELIFDESDEPAEAGMATEQIPDASLFEEDDEDELIAVVPPARERRRRVREVEETTRVGSSSGSGVTRTRPRVSRRPEQETENEGVFMLALLIASSLVLVLGAFVAYSATTSVPSGPSKFIMDLVYDKDAQ